MSAFRVKVPDALVALGNVLDVVVEHNGRRTIIDWRKPHWLATDASRKVLYILPAVSAHARTFPERAQGQVRELAAVFRTWSDFEPRRCHQTPAVAVRGRWQLRGRVVRLGYRSDKWTGKTVDYEHDFDGRPRLLQLKGLYRISGGFAVKAAGITG